MCDVNELADSLKRLDRIVVKQEVRARWNLSDLDGTRPKSGQIRECLVGLAIKKETWNGQGEKLLNEAPGIRLSHRLKAVSVIGADIHVQRHIVRDDLVACVS